MTLELAVTIATGAIALVVGGAGLAIIGLLATWGRQADEEQE